MKSLVLLAFLVSSFNASAISEESKNLVTDSFYGWKFNGTYGGLYSGITNCSFDNGSTKTCSQITRADVIADMDVKQIEASVTNSALADCYRENWATCEVKTVLSEIVLNQPFRIYPDPQVVNTAYRTGYKTTVVIRATR